MLGGTPSEPKFCERILIDDMVNLTSISDVKIEVFKIKLIDNFITKKSFSGAAAVPTPQGIFLLGRKKKKCLVIHSISEERKLITIKYARKDLFLLKPMDLSNANIWFSDEVINYIFPNPLSPEEHTIGCLLL